MSYTDRLKDWLKTQDEFKNKKKSPLIQFLAHKNDITEALLNGHTRLEIWSHLTATAEIKCRYPTFTKYIAEHINIEKKVVTETDDERQPSPSSVAANKKKKQQEEIKSKPPLPPLEKKFIFNSNPNDEDLF